MGKKGNWFSAVKKALSPEPKEKKKDKTTPKSKKKWFGRHKDLDPISSSTDAMPIPAPPQPIEDVKLAEAENEQSKHAYSVALATAVAAEAAVAAAHAAAEVVRLTTLPHLSGKSEEEVAAIKIQTAFRGYLARRALRALRGLVRLKSLIQGQSVQRQATATLRCMQTLARVQSQIRARRIRMSEENLALQRQLQLKHSKELEKMTASMGDDWDDSIQSKEKIEANIQNRHEAAVRRERALAYAFSHQQTWKNSSKPANPTFMDPSNPQWGWSWLERWMAVRPWESRSAVEKEQNGDRASMKSTTSRAMSVGEISRPRDLNLDKKLSPTEKPSPTAQRSSRPPSRQSPSTPPSKAHSSSSVAGKTKPASSKGSGWGADDDSRSMLSVQSERYRRHSVAGSSIRDDESLASSPAVPSYMASTESTRARSRLPSPLGLEKNETPERGSSASAKKRLSFPASPTGTRRHSGPPRVESSSIKALSLHTEAGKWSKEVVG